MDWQNYGVRRQFFGSDPGKKLHLLEGLSSRIRSQQSAISQPDVSHLSKPLSFKNIGILFL